MTDPLDYSPDESTDPVAKAIAADGLLPAPVHLLSTVLEAVRQEPAHGVAGTAGTVDAVPAARIARGVLRPNFVRAAAAALAIALGAHLAFGGGDAGAALTAIRDLPVPEALAPDLGITNRAGASWQRVGDAIPRLADTPDLVPGSPGVLLAAGASMLGIGLFLASRGRRA